MVRGEVAALAIQEVPSTATPTDLARIGTIDPIVGTTTIAMAISDTRQHVLHLVT